MFRLPHPLLMLTIGVALAAALTWVLPAGEYDRREDSTTGRRVAVAGTYHPAPSAPAGPFAAVVAIPRGFVAAAEVIALVLFVGGAWVVVDRVGSIAAVVSTLIGRFARGRLALISLVTIFFGVMGALENMQEEIIPLVPALLVLGRALGVDAVTVVAMSAGAAMVGSAYGPTNPFQAGIALKLAQLPPLSAGGLRLAMLVVGLGLWIAWTMRRAAGTESSPASAHGVRAPLPFRHALVLLLVVVPMGLYVYGALALGWGFNELSAAFLVGGMAAGLVGGLGIAGTLNTFLEGTQAMVPSVLMVGVARSITIVLEEGHVVDTLLHGLVAPLAHVPAAGAGLLMILANALIHIAVPSVSGHAVLAMPIFAPLADVLGLSRQVAVLAYQTGAGLMEMLTPTNGALMALLLAAGVPFQQWFRFAFGGVILLALVGAAAIALV